MTCIVTQNKKGKPSLFHRCNKKVHKAGTLLLGNFVKIHIASKINQSYNEVRQ
jgi:hypothetical protein